MRSRPWLLASFLLLAAHEAWAHGVIGARFFPATLTIDDPFVADEMSLLTVGVLKTPANGTMPAIRGTDYRWDLAKRLSRNVGMEWGGTYRTLNGEDGSSSEGWDNVDAAVQYQFYKDLEHETVTSVKLDWDMGGTGRSSVADPFSTFTPALLFGKGFGNLPDSFRAMRALAVTGILGTSFPTHGMDRDTGNAIPRVAQWGFTIQYNLQYLQTSVKDIGLCRPFGRMVPLVELPMQTPWNGTDQGRTTGTANPGVIWFGRFVQLALEARIPINASSGKGVGAIGQIHLYLDDIAPTIFTWTPFSGTLGPTQPHETSSKVPVPRS